MEQAEIIVGYTTYVDLIRPLIQDKKVISTAMTKEVQRVNGAIDAACKGRTVALVSSGDSGIYAMAGLVWELCQARNVTIVPRQKERGISGSIAVEVVPGIPALCAGAALLGAPLTHDFAVISLSDLLTPWEVIEKRIAAAAQADFVLVIYNPGSKKRIHHLGRAGELILQYRNGHTPVGIVTGAMRPNQAVRITTLDKMGNMPIDMQTIVFVGNSTTRQAGVFLHTLRGYGEKYNIASPNSSR